MSEVCISLGQFRVLKMGLGVTFKIKVRLPSVNMW